jgi:hypothetical protein
MENIMKTLKTLVMIAVLALAVNATALEHECGVRLIVGEPTGQFGDNVDTEAAGLALHYGVRPQPSLTFGIGLNAMNYGNEKTEFSMPLVEDFERVTNNNLAGTFVFAQYRPLDGRIQPYAEAKFGFNYMWTDTKLSDDDWWDDDDVARKTNQDDFAKFWGGGGGLLIQVREGDGCIKSPGVMIDFKVTFLQGDKAEYLTEGDIEIVNNKPVYDVRDSEINMTTYELGVVLTF